MAAARDPAGAFVVGPELLAAGRGQGPLTGSTVAVKDVVDVRGLVTGAGNPSWRLGSVPATANAPVVDRLLDAGADLVGTTVCDELAFSLSGTNVHDGTPANPVDPRLVPGGSSSGSASAVGHGLVDLGVGTDTGGSIRVPASYCGVIGYRPTHGRVPVAGVVPLAPSFDTVGLFARSARLLSRAAAAVLDPGPSDWAPSGLFLADEVLGLADPGVASAVMAQAVTTADQLGLPLEHGSIFEPDELHDALRAFRTIQMREAWQAHGDWIMRTRPAFGPGVAERFAEASRVTDDDVAAAHPVRRRIVKRLRLVHDAGFVVVHPSASGTAPPIDLAGTDKADVRGRTMTITAPAGLAGVPVVGLPLVWIGGLPVGVSIVGPRGSDEQILELACRAIDRPGQSC
jgi:Asp-tRNA(Asn)/Glu-tRNA(Gln) amidotransferase A subunit family amidase